MSDKVETVQASSAARLADLHARCFAAGWSAAEIASLLNLPGCMALASSKGTGFIAMALFRSAADEAELLTLATDPDHRRRGLAERVLAAGEDRLSDTGITRIFLEVSTGNPGAQALYLAVGYTEIARRPAYYRDGSDALVLEKWLRKDGQTAP
ncbi:GNAT family N-acetyltransferase [Maricaulis sp. W15]|uniref:GNAT family N-acetyltransferase n=1 Tax=Maricaulis sp. W15 TaxID=1772333 RepID=UPI0009490E47|nr:GNAT family N-acetyltransferase [Maricaulis sp. W15]